MKYRNEKEKITRRALKIEHDLPAGISLGGAYASLIFSADHAEEAEH
jgi:hypothetical protein